MTDRESIGTRRRDDGEHWNRYWAAFDEMTRAVAEPARPLRWWELL